MQDAWHCMAWARGGGWVLGRQMQTGVIKVRDVIFSVFSVGCCSCWLGWPFVAGLPDGEGWRRG